MGFANHKRIKIQRLAPSHLWRNSREEKANVCLPVVQLISALILNTFCVLIPHYPERTWPFKRIRRNLRLIELLRTRPKYEMKVKAILAICLAAAPASLALGINCRGSSQCFMGRWAPGDCGKDGMQRIGATLKYAVEEGYGNRTYFEGGKSAVVASDGRALTDHLEKIACHGHCCAFYQNGGAGTVEDALRHVDNLRDHGCKGCGSDPVNPGNDVAAGELTVNWVQGGGRCEEGELCWPYEREAKVLVDSDTLLKDIMSSERSKAAKAVAFDG